MSPSGALTDTSPGPADEPPTGRRVRRRHLLAAAGALAFVLVALGAYVLTRDTSPAPPNRAEVGKIAAQAAKKAVDDARAAPATSAVVYQQILPSIVEIQTDNPGKKSEGTGLGAGVIVNRNGAILTAFHVVDGASRVRVSFVDGTKSTAVIASSDPANDIAVLMPERGPEPIVPAVLGGGARVGDEAYAVGHPLGLAGTLTAGVISGLDRTVEGKDGHTLRGLIQFDAAVNPGNSGGPLLNRGGQVIGIVTALANPSRDGYFIGIGFAVPIGTAGGAANVPPK